MRLWMLIAGSTVSVAIGAGDLSAQEGGQYDDLLIEALEAAADQSCPEDIMSPMLLDACEQQMPRMGQQIASLGPIQRVRYRGTQSSQMGPVEVYSVEFRRGRMTWMINTGSDGKILVLWSPG